METNFYGPQNPPPQNIANWEKTFTEYLEKHYQPSDNAHDLAHFQRVWKVAQSIMTVDKGANPLVVMAACYFHDWVSFPKDHPLRSTSSTLAAKGSAEVLKALDFPQDLIPSVSHAVAAHSYSADIRPTTLEAKIVQDADRMEAIGYIGIARCFSVAGSLKHALFDSGDPLAQERALDDQSYALDHFQNKLLKLGPSMKTEGGRRLAQQRSQVVESFMKGLAAEVLGTTVL